MGRTLWLNGVGEPGFKEMEMEMYRLLFHHLKSLMSLGWVVEWCGRKSRIDGAAEQFLSKAGPE